MATVCDKQTDIRDISCGINLGGTEIESRETIRRRFSCRLPGNFQAIGPVGMTTGRNRVA